MDVDRNRIKPILLTIGAILLVIFIILPFFLILFNGKNSGNVALIPIEGAITVNGGKQLGSLTASSELIVSYIEDAEKNSQIKVILLEINSPGGSAVASDEIAVAIKKVKKPVISLIREVGASGGYWVASATDKIFANRMSITGSIGVISSYLEFSGLMEKYGVGYERLVAGNNKDMGTPLKKLEESEREFLQGKLNQIQTYFIDEIAGNRNLNSEYVRNLATGEFFLGVEALNLGLIDQLGDKNTVEEYLKTEYGIEEPDYLIYKREVGFLDLFTGVFTDFFFSMGEGFGSILIKGERNLNLLI